MAAVALTLPVGNAILPAYCPAAHPPTLQHLDYPAFA